MSPSPDPPSSSPSPSFPLRLALFGTHVSQSNGYAKVIYELVRQLGRVPPEKLQVFLFGFQREIVGRKESPATMRPLPTAPNLTIFDAAAHEAPRAKGFGVHLVKEFLALARPHAVVVFNDLVVIKSVLDEIVAACPSPRPFRLLAYVDQVYGSQNRALLEMVNVACDRALTFTPSWVSCLLRQGLRLPCDDLPHGLDTDTYYPVPSRLARRYLGLPEGDDAFLVLNLNRNQPRKRWDVCMQAWAQFVAEEEEEASPTTTKKTAALVIATQARTGAWDLVDLYARELNKRGVPLQVGMRHIIFVDAPQRMTDRDINLLYNACDVGINTCDGEGFGMCNFEHAAVGKPQVVAAVGGLRDIFDDTCATLVQPVTTFYVTDQLLGGEAAMCSHVDFARALRRYRSDRELATRHGKEARRRILSGYRWPSIAARLYAACFFSPSSVASVVPRELQEEKQAQVQAQEQEQEQQNDTRMKKATTTTATAAGPSSSSSSSPPPPPPPAVASSSTTTDTEVLDMIDGIYDHGGGDRQQRHQQQNKQNNDEFTFPTTTMTTTTASNDPGVSSGGVAATDDAGDLRARVDRLTSLVEHLRSLYTPTTRSEQSIAHMRPQDASAGQGR